MTAMSVDDQGTTSQPANTTISDNNGTFSFPNLSPGDYNLTAHKMILGSMHFMGTTSISLKANTKNVTIMVSRSDDAHFAAFNNSSVKLIPGQFSLSGIVIGPSRPGAKTNTTTYDNAVVKITSFVRPA